MRTDDVASNEAGRPGDEGGAASRLRKEDRRHIACDQGWLVLMV